VSARLAPLTGALFVAFVVASAAIAGEPPDFDSSGQDVISFYADDETAQTWSSVLFAWGAISFIFFASTLRGLLRPAEAARDSLSAVVFGGGLLVAVGMGIFASMNFTLADAADEETFEPAAAQTLNMLNGDFFFPVAIGFAAMFLAIGLAVIRRGGLPAWLGWIALVFGVLGFTPVGFFALVASLLWTLIVSIYLATRSEEGPILTGTPPPPPPPPVT
jgi:hypothetical protein